MTEGPTSTEQLRGGVQPARTEAGELYTTSTINIFAIHDKVTKTHEDYVTEQGFGVSSPLIKPEVIESTYYRWQGRLHPNAAERASKNKDRQRYSYNVQDSLEGLAENFAENYRNRQNPVLQQRGEASYSLQFQPTQEQINELMIVDPNVKRVVRGLNQEERERFMTAFRKANQAAAQNNKQTQTGLSAEAGSEGGVRKP